MFFLKLNSNMPSLRFLLIHCVELLLMPYPVHDNLSSVQGPSWIFSSLTILTLTAAPVLHRFQCPLTITVCLWHNTVEAYFVCASTLICNSLKGAFFLAKASFAFGSEMFWLSLTYFLNFKSGKLAFREYAARESWNPFETRFAGIGLCLFEGRYLWGEPCHLFS